MDFKISLTLSIYLLYTFFNYDTFVTMKNLLFWFIHRAIIYQKLNSIWKVFHSMNYPIKTINAWLLNIKPCLNCISSKKKITIL